MIQRIQSLYLLAGIVLSAAVLISGVFVITQGSEFAIVGAFGIKEGALPIDNLLMLPLAILAGLVLAIDGVALSQFKNRKLQITLTQISVLLAVVMIAWVGYQYYLLMGMDVKVNPIMGIFHSPMILFANVLAARAIRKDDNLVKSVDRLR
jgi:hypothetical protein